MEAEIQNRFKVFLAGIVFDPSKRKVLIARKEEELYLPGLTWCFPGAKLINGDDMNEKLKSQILEKTGYHIKDLGAVFSKVYPEQKDLMTVYFLCEIEGGEEKAGGDLIELKWVNPEEIEEHFTTSFHPILKEYIMNLK